jgi:hypothetical protein
MRQALFQQLLRLRYDFSSFPVFKYNLYSSCYIKHRPAPRVASVTALSSFKSTETSNFVQNRLSSSRTFRTHHCSPPIDARQRCFPATEISLKRPNFRKSKGFFLTCCRHAWDKCRVQIPNPDAKDPLHEPSATNARTIRSVSDASFQYTEAFPGKSSELPDDQVDRYAVRTFLDQDLPVSSEYMEDAQFVLKPGFNAEDNSPHDWNYASGLVDSYDAPMTTFQAPSMADVSGNVPPAPALPQFQFDGLVSTVTTGPTQPSVTNRLTCQIHGCRGTFGRASEYRRHMTKHQGRSFPCTQLGCSKSFYRNDKLRDHLRQAHKIIHPGRAHAAAVTGVQNAATSGGSGQM